MRVLHVSTSDVRGGASRAAYRLHDGLRRLGHESSMLVWDRASTDPSVHAFVPSTRLVDRVARRVRQRRIVADLRAVRGGGHELFTHYQSQFGAEVARQLPECDVLHLHWTSGILDYPLFFRDLPPGVPVVWTLHDMNPFTGGCHYDQGCGGYIRACGSCPQLASGVESDLSRQVWQGKREALSRLGDRPVHVVADSAWLAEEARRSSLLGAFPVSTIYYGLDTGVFAPRGRSEARQALGIPEDARVVLFVADSVEDRRKGLSHLLDALEGMAGFPDLLLVSIGRGEPAVREGGRHLHLGRVDDDFRLSLVYSAADVFVIPSLQEAFGQTALEAVSCGTPVVGFAAGGIPEIVRPGVTGALAPPGDNAALREAIVGILRDPEAAARLSESCRRVALEGHGLERQARQYLDLYTRLRGEPSPPAETMAMEAGDVLQGARKGAE